MEIRTLSSLLILSHITLTQTLIFKPKEWFNYSNVFIPESYSINHIEVLNEQKMRSSLKVFTELVNAKNDTDVNLVLVKYHFTRGLRNQRHEQNLYIKSEAKNYIENILGNLLGIDSVFEIPFKVYSNNKHLKTAMNIFAVLKGPQYNKPNDTVLILSTHWDSFPGTAGADDDASGTIAIFELIRLLQMRRSSFPFSIYFVFFDFKEYGLIGSYAFVNDYLRPKIVKGSIRVIGGINFDGILNYNASIGSQKFFLNSSVANVNPIQTQHYDRSYMNVDGIQVSGIQRSGSKGDFICVHSRVDHDNAIIDAIRSAFDSFKHKIDMKLHVFKAPLPKQGSLDVLTTYNKNYTQFLQSDHLNFWYTFPPRDQHAHNDSNQLNFTIPAVLFTDTGILRGIQQNCFHKTCDSMAQLNNNNLQFMADTIRTVNIAIDLLAKKYSLKDTNKNTNGSSEMEESIAKAKFDELALQEEQLNTAIVLLVVVFVLISTLFIGVFKYTE